MLVPVADGKLFSPARRDRERPTVRDRIRYGRAAAFAAMTFGAPALVSAQTGVAGHWEGVARVAGQAALRIEIVLDSTAGGWQGSLRAPAQRAEPFTFVLVQHLQDSLILHLADE